MGKQKKYLILMLAMLMSVSMLLAGCGGNAGPDPQEEVNTEENQDDSRTAESVSGYNIMEGFEELTNDDGSIKYLYFNDFMMVMPGSGKWSCEPAEDGQSVTFYLDSAKDGGYGGRLVTIAAFDINDDSYKNLPSYSVAGTGSSTNMRFVAEFPTDVQWNGEDPEQDADYRDLSDYVHKIGEGAVNSPLTTGDSSPEPQAD